MSRQDITWRATTLGQEVSPRGGLQTGPFGSQLKADEYVAGGIPVILPRDLVNGTIEHDGSAAVTEAKAVELGRHRIRPGDLLLARRGEVGRGVLITEEHEGWVCGTGCIRIRPGERLDSRFLAHYLRWEHSLGWFLGRSVGGTVLRNLNRRIAGRLPLYLPPTEHQRELADIFDGLDGSIELRCRLRDRERSLHRVLMCRLLGLPHAGMGSPLPAGWRWASLRELCTMVNGHRFESAPSEDAGQPVIRIRNLNGSRQFKRFAGYVKPRWRVSPGDLLFAWAGLRRSLGPYLWDGPAGVLNQHIFRVEPAPGIARHWLYEVLRELTDEMVRGAQGFKASLQHFRKRELVEQPIPVPPVEEQQRVAEWSREFARQEKRRQAACEAAERMKQELMEDVIKRGLGIELGCKEDDIEASTVAPGIDGSAEEEQDRGEKDG